jgi:hypothetical protein
MSKENPNIPPIADEYGVIKVWAFSQNGDGSLSPSSSGGSSPSAADIAAAIVANPATVPVEDLAATALPTAVTGGTLVQPMADKFGRAAVVLNAVRDLVGTAVLSNNSAASAASLIGAGADGVYNDIITFIATNRSATATVVTLTDGTVSYTFALAANGGIVINFPTPLCATTAATAWTVGNSGTVACDYVAVYAKNK